MFAVLAILAFVACIMACFGLLVAMRRGHIIRNKDLQYLRLEHNYRTLRDQLRLEMATEAESLKKQKIHEGEEQAQLQLARLRDAFNRDNATFVSEALASEAGKDTANRIREVVLNNYSRVTQEFLGTIGDETDGLAIDIQLGLCETIWDSFQQMKEKQKESPWILPDDCRMAYTKDKRTVVVIEETPQVRNVMFTEGLLKTGKEKLAAVKTDQGHYRFTLAFPYVYFVLVFDDGNYTYHNIYFRNKALTSTREHIYLAPLPNVFSEKSQRGRGMCMGNGFWEEVGSERTIARQCLVA